jgi:hypothetical protein
MLKTFSGRNASQNEFELRSFIALLVSKNVQRYLEIGARHGDTFHEVMLSLPAGSVGVAVDFPGALWGTSKSKSHLVQVVEDLNKRGYRCFAVFGDSTKKQTIETIRKLGREEEGAWAYDAALIDGDHTLPGVRADWINFRDAAPVIAFHDIVGEGQKEKVSYRDVEVPRFWAELKESKDDKWMDTVVHKAELIEYVDEGSHMGIGVVCK